MFNFFKLWITFTLVCTVSNKEGLTGEYKRIFHNLHNSFKATETISVLSSYSIHMAH